MIRIGVCQWSLDRGGVAALTRAARLGFAGIQLGIADEETAAGLTEPALRQDYLQAAEETGVAILGFGVNALNRYPLHSHPDSEDGRRAWRLLCSALDTALAMQVSLVYCPAFLRGEIRTDEELARASAMLRRGCEYVAGRPLLLATENSLDAAGHLRLIEQVGHPALRVLVDSYNPVVFGHRATDLLLGLPAEVLCDQMHVKDGLAHVMGSASLGQGEGHFEEFAHMLQARAFDGWLICENDYTTDAEERVAADLATLTRLFND